MLPITNMIIEFRKALFLPFAKAYVAQAPAIPIKIVVTTNAWYSHLYSCRSAKALLYVMVKPNAAHVVPIPPRIFIAAVRPRKTMATVRRTLPVFSLINYSFESYCQPWRMAASNNGRPTALGIGRHLLSQSPGISLIMTTVTGHFCLK